MGSHQRSVSSKIQPCRLMQMGCVMSLKVQPCCLIRVRSPHIRHLFAASFRFLAASHTIRLPLAYHSHTTRLPLSTSRQGDRVIKTEKGALQVTLRAPSNSFYVHYPEWYSGNPKRSAPPLVVYPAALPKFVTSHLSFWFSARRWFAEFPQSVGSRYTCRLSRLPRRS